jgi:hypothetical protein
VQPVVDGDERDDQLRSVAEGRVQEPTDAGAGAAGEMVGRLADQPGERDEGGAGKDEEGHVSDAAEMIEDDDDRPEEQQRCESEGAARDERTFREPRSSCKPDDRAVRPLLLS